MASELESKFTGRVLLFALSTCVMCRGVRNLLNGMDIQYECVYVDLLPPDEKRMAKDEMRKWNPRCPFPMLIVNGTKCVIGDEPATIKEALQQ